ncbi:MAG: glycosyltransferase family 2 protein [Thermoproteota archaeon]|nr:glycosyltransferase family 2 protein [Thermoproteota archaeon]
MVSVLTLILLAILFSSTLVILAIWLYLMIFTLRSLRAAPKLELFPTGNKNRDLYYSHTRVSIIVPARNEERHIRKCLQSILKQDYPNIEIIAVNDSSSDRTREIIQEYSSSVRSGITIIHVDVQDKPEGWSGKNWACYQGYLRASGDLFLFLDADTVLTSSFTISTAISYLCEYNLDALTVRPKLLCQDTWAKITLPMLSTLLHVRRMQQINNPLNRTSGYLFGCFYLITRESYEAIGTHRAVKGEIIEDAAIGKRIRNQNYLLRAVIGDGCIESIFRGRWSILQRIVVPRYHKRKTTTILAAMVVFFITLYPFILFPILFTPSLYLNGDELFLHGLAVTIDLLSIGAIISTSIIQLKFSIFESLLYALASPVAGTIISLGFIIYIIDARINDTLVSWHGRKYTIAKGVDGSTV